LPKVLPRTGSGLLRPFRAFLLRGVGSQGAALGYNTTPLQGLTLIFGFLRALEYSQQFRRMPSPAVNLAPQEAASHATQTQPHPKHGCGYV